MPIFGWIRDIFGIQKDMYETKKIRLEINKLEDAEREKLITPATMDDVRRYDPKIRRIELKIRRRKLKMESRPPRTLGHESFSLAGCVAVLLILLIMLLLWWFGHR